MPAVGVRIRTDEDGEILARTNHVFDGYWNQPDETAKALDGGWFHTGDGGHLDGPYTVIADRKKDVIITGGENVSSIEVEDCLYQHAAVAEAAVIGVPDDKWGETVKALVVLRPGAVATEAELIEFCRARLAHFKAPTSVELRDGLVRTATGKLQKYKLRHPYWEGRTTANRRGGDQLSEPGQLGCGAWTRATPVPRARAHHDPLRWRLPVTPAVCTPGRFLYGGCGLAAGIVALEAASGRPTVWATAQYLAYAPTGTRCSTGRWSSPPPARNTTQGRAIGRLGRGGGADRQRRPRAPRPRHGRARGSSPRSVPAPRGVPRAGDPAAVRRLGARCAWSTAWPGAALMQDLDGRPGDARSAFWARVPGTSSPRRPPWR